MIGLDPQGCPANIECGRNLPESSRHPLKPARDKSSGLAQRRKPADGAAGCAPQEQWRPRKVRE